MGSVFRRRNTRALPPGAKIAEHKGQAFAVWSDAAGKTHRKPAKLVAEKWKLIHECAYYYAKFRGPDNIYVERPTGCKTMDAARSVLADLERDAERQRIGAVTPRERNLANQGARQLTELFEEYKKAQRVRGVTAGHVEACGKYLISMKDDCDWMVLTDLDRADLDKWIERLRNHGKKARAVNARIKAAKAFCNWLVSMNRLHSNPFAGVVTFNESIDPVRQRRALTLVELKSLIESAERRPLDRRRTGNRGTKSAKLSPATAEHLATTGRVRALVYRVLAYTGMRYGELRSITVGQLNLDVESPFIELRAANEKARRGAHIPLRVDLICALREYLDVKLKSARTTASNNKAPIPVTLDPQVRLFTLPEKLTRVFDLDIKFAGIAKRDSNGRTVDVHALRHTFGTMLARAGVPLQQTQALMRHSDPKITANVYTHLGVVDGFAAVTRLPDLPADDEEKIAEAVAADSITPNITPTPGNSIRLESITSRSAPVQRDAGKRETKREMPACASVYNDCPPVAEMKNGRGDWIRTSDPLPPRQVR